jgi:hypothetical protein
MGIWVTEVGLAIDGKYLVQIMGISCNLGDIAGSARVNFNLNCFWAFSAYLTVASRQVVA